MWAFDKLYGGSKRQKADFNLSTKDDEIGKCPSKAKQDPFDFDRHDGSDEANREGVDICVEREEPKYYKADQNEFICLHSSLAMFVVLISSSKQSRPSGNSMASTVEA